MAVMRKKPWEWNPSGCCCDEDCSESCDYVWDLGADPTATTITVTLSGLSTTPLSLPGCSPGGPCDLGTLPDMNGTYIVPFFISKPQCQLIGCAVDEEYHQYFLSNPWGDPAVPLCGFISPAETGVYVQVPTKKAAYAALHGGSPTCGTMGLFSLQGARATITRYGGALSNSYGGLFDCNGTTYTVTSGPCIDTAGATLTVTSNP